MYQDAIGQLPILKTYNHVTLGFELVDGQNQGGIVRTLRHAVAKLTRHFPWLGGAVVNEGKAPGSSGIFKTVPWPSDASFPNEILLVKDCTTTVRSFRALVAASAPSSMLDGRILASRPGFPESYEDSPSQPAPVLMIQANFIDGGLLLTFSTQHNMIDASGLLQVMYSIATIMQGRDITQQAVEQGNRDRAMVIPLIKAGEPVKNHDHLKRPPSHPWLTSSASSSTTPTWAYWRLHGHAVSDIKALASRPEGYDTLVPFISTNDALSAFYWKSIASVRACNGRSPDSISRFGRAIDSRKAMGVPSEYMGHMVYHAATRMTLRELVEMPLSTIATRLRRDLNDVNNEFSVRSYATYIANEPDKSQILYGGLFNPDIDIGSSAVSSANFSMHFGPLGVAQFARRPNLAPILGCVYFMPPEDGDLIVLVCLRHDDMEGLKRHMEWGRVSDFIG